MSSIQTFSRLALKQFCALLEGVAVTESSAGDLESAIWEKIKAGNPEEAIRVPYPLIKKSLRKSKLELPYMPGVINYNIGCQALKVSGGLYLPCCGKCDEEDMMGIPSEYCAPCNKHGLKYGTMADRGDVGTYSDPTDKHEISFGTWLAKNEKTVEEVQEALLEEGFVLTIPSHHLTVNSKRIVKEVKARKGRPKAAKKEVTGDDSDSGSESESEKPKPKAKKTKSPKSSDDESDKKSKKVKAEKPKKVKSPKSSDDESDEEKPKKKEKKVKSPKNSDGESDGEKPKKKEKKLKSPSSSDDESDVKKSKSKKSKDPEPEKKVKKSKEPEPEPEKKVKKSKESEPDSEKKVKKVKAPKAEEKKPKKEKKAKSPKNSDDESDGEKKVDKKEKKKEKNSNSPKANSEKSNDISARFGAELTVEEYVPSGFDSRAESHGEGAEEIFIEGTKYMLRDGNVITDILTGEIVGSMDEDGEPRLNNQEEGDF